MTEGNDRIDLKRGWARLKDLKRVNYGEAKRLRRIAASGDEDSGEKALLACVIEWEVYDFQTDEALTEVSLATLDRLNPADVEALASAMGEALTSTLPKASPSG